MAWDLAHTPTTGLRVQACGDAHLLNFGMFAAPDRRLVFDINDFDETLPAPFEWDVKRLAASFAVAARDNGFSDAEARDAARLCARSYRTEMANYATMRFLKVWYSRIDVDEVSKLFDAVQSKEAVRRRNKDIAKAYRRTSLRAPRRGPRSWVQRGSASTKTRTEGARTGDTSARGRRTAHSGRGKTTSACQTSGRSPW